MNFTDVVVTPVRERAVSDKDIVDAYNRELRPAVAALANAFNRLVSALEQGTVTFGVQTFSPVPEPSPPAAGDVLVYLDEADGLLKKMDDAGIVTVIA